MANRSIAIETLERMAVQMQGIQEAAQQLREIGSFEGARDELSRAVASQKAELAKLHAAVAGATSDVASAKSTAETILSDANTQAGLILTEARHQAAAITTKAEEAAALALDSEKTTRQHALAALMTQLADSQKKLKATQEASVKAEQDALAIERRAASAQEALEKVQAQARALSGR